MENQNGETAQPQKMLARKETPSVLAAFPGLKRGNQELKMRVLQYSRTEPVLDIREYIVSDQFNGFTKKGISINLEQCRQLLAQLPAMITALEEV
jgi:hypothetical protein